MRRPAVGPGCRQLQLQPLGLIQGLGQPDLKVALTILQGAQAEPQLGEGLLDLAAAVTAHLPLELVVAQVRREMAVLTHDVTLSVRSGRPRNDPALPLRVRLVSGRLLRSGMCRARPVSCGSRP